MQTTRNIAVVLLALALAGLAVVIMLALAKHTLDFDYNAVTPVPRADVNQDGEVNVLDVQAVVNTYLDDNGDPFEVCSLVEQPTVTPTPTSPVLCEALVVPTATPTHGTPPPATRTPEPDNTSEPSSTDVPPSTEMPPEPTDKPKCNRGLGNGSEECDPGNSGGKPGSAGENNEPGGP